MKLRYAAFAFLSLLIGLGISASSHVEVEMTVARTLSLEETPVDTALSGGREIHLCSHRQGESAGVYAGRKTERHDSGRQIH